MRRIGQRLSPGIARQSLPATPLTTSWRLPRHRVRRRYTAHCNTGLLRRSIAHATLVFSAFIRSSGPQSRSASSCHPIFVSKGSNSSVHVGPSLYQGELFLRATLGHLQAIQNHLRAITGPRSGHLHHGHSKPLPGHLRAISL